MAYDLRRSPGNHFFISTKPKTNSKMAGLTEKWIRERIATLDPCALANILALLNGLSAEQMDGPEPKEGPIYDDPSTGYSGSRIGYDIGGIVARRIVKRRDEIGKFTDFRQLAGIPYLGEDKFNDLVQSAADGYAPTKIVITDVSGLSLGPNYPGRIPASETPDGIACDGLEGVREGARLLVRILVSKKAYDTCKHLLKADFGYMYMGSFADLPQYPPLYEGSYLQPSSQEADTMKAMGLRMEGEVYEHPVQAIPDDYVVLKARLYAPPTEMNLHNAADKSEFRPLTLAVDFVSPNGWLFEKALRLTKPPMVLVHGINSDPTAWKDFVEHFETLGYKAFTADHSGTLEGNGDIHSSYAAVRKCIFDGPGVASALDDLRSGKAYGVKVAVQKCDIVAHSYGGLLSRWYMEQSGEFEDRKDVRKLITLGTPHRGAPVTNLLCETYRNPDFYNAEVGSWFPTPGYHLGDMINDMNDGKLYKFVEDMLKKNGLSLGAIAGAHGIKWARKQLRFRWHDGGNPPDNTEAGEKKIVPSLQVMSFGSEVLAQLNANPFLPNVAYGSIVGTDETIFGVFNAYQWLTPYQDSSFGPDGESYFPWAKALDGGDGESDGIVPVWSQVVPPRTFAVNAHHLNMTYKRAVFDEVFTMLTEHFLPRGSTCRGHFRRFQGLKGKPLDGLKMESRRNAYLGSKLTGTQSLGAGIRPDAIHKVWFELDKTVRVAQDGHPALTEMGGIIKVTATGMAVRPRQLLSIYGDTGYRYDLVNGISVPYRGSGELRTFRVTAYIGRRLDGGIAGKDGANLAGPGKYRIGWRISGPRYLGWDALSSPHALVHTTPFSLPKVQGPSVVGTSGADFKAVGGIEVIAGGKTRQGIHLVIADYDPFLNPDDPLVHVRSTIQLPIGAFPGAVVPYDLDFRLHKNASGYVAGADGHSGENRAEVIQSYDHPVTGWEASSYKKVEAQ